MTATQIYERLTALAPAVTFGATRSQDCYTPRPDPDPAEEGYNPYDVDVKAATIVGGKLVKESTHLGGSYMRADEPIDDIGGHLPKMLEKSAENLKKRLTVENPAYWQLDAVLEFLKSEMQARWRSSGPHRYPGNW